MNESKFTYFPLRRWRDLLASSSWSLASNQMGLSGMQIMPKNITKLKLPRMKDITSQSTKAPMMYVVRIPAASSVAVSEHNVPRILVDEHSLTCIEIIVITIKIITINWSQCKIHVNKFVIADIIYYYEFLLLYFNFLIQLKIWY